MSPAFPFTSAGTAYLRFFRAAAFAALFRARVRAPFLADALRAALLRPRVAAPLLAAALRPRLFAAAMLSLHDEVETLTCTLMEPASPAPRPDRHAVYKGSGCDDERESLLVTRREYRMQEMCVQCFLQSTRLKC
jgi:hypothetical protein